MRTETEVTKISSVTHVTCDVCGGVISRHFYRCHGCGIDVCGTPCGVWRDSDPFSGGYLSDESVVVCRACDNKLKPYIEAVHRSNGRVPRSVSQDNRICGTELAERLQWD